MIGGGGNFTGSGFIIPADEVTKMRQMTNFVPKERSLDMKVKEQVSQSCYKFNPRVPPPAFIRAYKNPLETPTDTR